MHKTSKNQQEKKIFTTTDPYRLLNQVFYLQNSNEREIQAKPV
jgi:hypothetical protein